METIAFCCHSSAQPLLDSSHPWVPEQVILQSSFRLTIVGFPKLQPFVHLELVPEMPNESLFNPVLLCYVGRTFARSASPVKPAVPLS